MPRAVLAFAAFVGLVARLGFSLGYWTHEPLTRDEREYLSLARGLAGGHGFTYDADVTDQPVAPFGRAPGYPAFLALVGGGRAVASSVPVAVKVAQAIVGAGGVWLAGLIAWRLAGRRAAMAAALIAAIDPPLVFIAAYALSEAIAWPIGLACVWWFDRAWNPASPHTRRAMVICGLLTGVLVLVRPATIIFVALGAVVLVTGRRTARALIFVAAATIVIAPWTIRNYVRDGRVVLVATEGGVTFWTGNHPLAIGEGDLAANPQLKLAQRALHDRHPGVSEDALEPIYYREAFDWMRAHPMDWIALEARKAFYLIVPIGPSYRLHSTRYYVASALSYGVVLVLGLAGIGRAGPGRARVPGLWCLVGSSVLTCLVFFPQERFRIPAIDPALVICAGAAVATPRDAETA